MSKSNQLSRVGEFLVIGGGIAGCTVAYELARRGERVTLLEQRSLATAASGRNMGLLINQVEPEALRMMEHALAIYREVERFAPLNLRRGDQLLLARRPEQLGSMEERARAMAAVGLHPEVLDPDELRRRWPGLAADVAGGALVPGGWLLDPALATVAFAEAARSAGADIRTGVRVLSARPDGVLTDAGRLAADAVVVAAGPWLADLVPDVPIGAARGWVMRTGPLSDPPPWIVEEMSWPNQDVLGRAARRPTLAEVAAGGFDAPAVEAVAIAPQPDGTCLIGTSMAPSLRDVVEGVGMPSRVARRALSAVPGLAEATIVASWSGMRPMTPDGEPIAGRCDGGLWIHGGHGSIGMQAAPATARWLVDAMLSGDTPSEVAALAPQRFARAAVQ
jgi:D-hydroxyproline dehydrogenase subunit beta